MPDSLNRMINERMIKKMKRIPATTENIKCWDDIPLVKLRKVLEQMIWFDGKYILNSYKYEYEKYTITPKSAQLEMQYREKSIDILCNWEVKEHYKEYETITSERFAIRIEKPHYCEFQTPRTWVNNQVIFRYSRFYSVAIDKIEDALYDAQEFIDNEITDEENEKKREVELEIIRKTLCENLDVSIMKSNYSNSYKYREDKEYHLDFEATDDMGELFEIEEIGGKYTQDDIKKIIEIIGSNPRAVAERLTKN